MTLHQLLATSAEKKQFEKSVICLTGDSYPLLFCSQFFTYLKKTHSVVVPVLDNVSSLQAQLGTSFLGSSFVYWLRSFDELSKAQKQVWFSYLHSYVGPHTIFFFSSELPRTMPASWSVIKMPSHADAQLITHMMDWYNGNAQAARAMVQKLTTISDQVALDGALLLVQYSLVMGSRSQEFFDSWLNHIVVPTSSLFDVSQALFAKQSRQFFTYLSPMQDYYVPQFWLSFWSEQLWRAAAYIRLMQARKPADAKRISFRLPFSFLNRDWRRYSIKELQRAHNFLYDIDYQLKHGASPVVLDLFYSKFLTGSFAS